ncbi:hypothetical protein P7C71_g4785, partial [Lecanoromycetidae sp. Uapishka_2]
MAAGALNSDQVNYLIWRYLQESAPKRNRRSNGTEVSTNGDHQMGDSMQLDHNGYHFRQDPLEPVSPNGYSPEDDGQANVMDIDNDADAPGSPTPEEQQILTLTNGQSIGVQSDKVAELGPQTSILMVPDNSHVMHTAWNPKDPTILAVAGEALCRLWYISRTASFTDNPNHKSYVDILDPAYGSYVSTMAWNPNGDTLAVATRDDSSDWIGAVSLWSKMGKAEDELPAAQDMVLKLRWSPSGNQLLGITTSGSGSSSILIWDRNSSPVAPYHLPNILTDATWTSNNQVTVCGDGIIASSLLEEGKIVTLHTRSESECRHSWTYLRYDSRTHTTALAAEESAILGLIDSSDTLRTTLAHDAEITAIAFQPVTNLSAYPASAPRLLATSSLDGSIIIWDAKRPFTIVHRLTFGYQAPAMAMSFTPDGFLVAVANENKVLIWNAEVGGVPKASWKGDLKRLTNGSLTNGNGVETMEEDGMDGEQNCSLSWDAECGKLALGLGNQIAIINFRP